VLALLVIFIQPADVSFKTPTTEDLSADLLNRDNSPVFYIEANSTDTSEDLTLSLSQQKKRMSWKHHRIESQLYGCDQCEKTFGKQSSLARHKYEHSGTIQ